MGISCVLAWPQLWSVTLFSLTSGLFCIKTQGTEVVQGPLKTYVIVNRPTFMISYVLRASHEKNSFLFEEILTVLIFVASDIDSLFSER